MKAAILVAQNQPLIVDEVELPEKLEYGQVLVKVFYTGICGSQLGEISGAKGDDSYLPHLLGHEGSGVVVSVGEGVKHVKENDCIVLHWKKGAGIEAVPPKYSWNGKVVNAGAVTTFSEYTIVSENRVTKISCDFNMQIAALFGCAVTTGLGTINNNAKLKFGDSVIIFGSGGIGLNMIQGAKMASAYPIVAVDLFDERLEFGKKFGATHTINTKNQDLYNEIEKIIGKSKFDVVIDNTGNTDVISKGYDLTSESGRLVLVGVPRKGDKANFYTLPIHFGKKIVGSHGGDTNPTVDIPKYVKLYEENILDLDSLITNIYTLGNINSAINDMRDGNIAGRCIVKMEDIE